LSAAPAAAQPASVCAQVKIEILQKLTFERVAFDARLVVTNNLSTQTLTEFGVTLNITTLDGADASNLFFVKVNSLDNISAVDGTGEIASGARAEIHWLIIPAFSAGGSVDLGQTYLVGGQVNFTVQSGARQLTLFPAPIIVKPQPFLDVDYFLPREVESDDPFTPAVEAPVPFPLGVRVSNRGFGTAGNLHITSGQPKIVENKQGLLIAFRLLGSSVDGKPTAPTLNASFGTIAAQKCGVADWEMVTSLSGMFVAFDASYTHSPDLGGELTSLIHGTTANVLVREMLVDLPGRDKVRDFLADTDHDPNQIPDQIFESDCVDSAVSQVAASAAGHPSAANPEIPLTTDVIAGWSFVKIPDPADGLVPLADVVRSDGKRLRPENFWVLKVVDKLDKTLFHYFVNVIDFETTGAYTLKYQRPAADVTPPVTSIVVQPPVFGSAPTFITPASQIIFTATDDISGVGSVEYHLDNDPNGFRPAFPFSIAQPGPHLLAFHSTDRSGNVEQDQTIQLFVDTGDPVIAPISPIPGVFVPSAPQGAPAFRETSFALSADDDVPDLSGVLEIASGTGGTFNSLPLVRSIPFTLRSGVARTLVWDGKSGAGVIVPAGLYTLRATVGDPLGHQSESLAVVEVKEFLPQTPPASAANADQQLPDLLGTRLVWQDNREGNWDIFTIDLGGGAADNLTSGQAADQMHPSTDGRYVVWQDRRNGNWDIFLHDLTNGTTIPFATEIADQENPVVDAPWVVWQENRSGQHDIVARNIDTNETVEVSAGDPGLHDQLRPAISGATVAFEDYRFGLAEIFTYDLDARQERRITNDVDNQTRASIDGNTVVWVDERDHNRELYMFDLASGVEKRLTYTATDETSPRVRDGRIVYVDFTAGAGDPSVSLYAIATRRSLLVTADPHRQEEPTTSGDRLAWQDDRTGRWQILTSEVSLSSLPIARDLGPGFNVVGITDTDAASHPSAFALLATWNGAAGV
ncbi:MAG TPA: hypothetical protein VE404_00855, partial [Verrucomicrobiae bacterium]|nr:hypothetical protein [Verrucomicrobiae bacterium]